jgi:hypothetical protein
VISIKLIGTATAINLPAIPNTSIGGTLRLLGKEEGITICHHFQRALERSLFSTMVNRRCITLKDIIISKTIIPESRVDRMLCLQEVYILQGTRRV